MPGHATAQPGVRSLPRCPCPQPLPAGVGLFPPLSRGERASDTFLVLKPGLAGCVLRRGAVPDALAACRGGTPALPRAPVMGRAAPRSVLGQLEGCRDGSSALLCRLISHCSPWLVKLECLFLVTGHLGEQSLVSEVRILAEYQPPALSPFVTTSRNCGRF